MRKKPVDAVDIQIINRLQKDANVTNRALAKEIGLSPGPTLVRVQNLWKRKLFSVYQAVVNYSYFKFNYKAVAIVSVASASTEQFCGNAHKVREIIYCAELEKSSQVVSSPKYLVIFMIKSQQHLDDSIVELNKKVNVSDIQITSITKVIKDTPLLLNHEDI